MATEDIKHLARSLYEVGTQLSDQLRSKDDVINMLKRVEDCLILVEQSPCDMFQLAMSPIMTTLKQHWWLRHPDDEIKLAVASCLSEIMRIITPQEPYGDDTMKEVLQLVVESLHGLYNVKDPTFGKRAKILEIIARTRSFVLMLDLQCNELTLQMFNCFIAEIKKRHSDKVKTNMFDILSMILDEDDDIYRKLKSDLLAIWREELVVSPCAYKFSKRLIEQKIERFREQMTEKELISMGLQVSGSPKKRRNQMRREQICFTCQEAWTPKHNCGVNKEKNLSQPSRDEDQVIDDSALIHEEQAETNPPDSSQAMENDIMEKGSIATSESCSVTRGVEEVPSSLLAAELSPISLNNCLAPSCDGFSSVLRARVSPLPFALLQR
ncbi:sister chromatid cohesion protein PDS5 homolog C-like [Cryptomeria japonica]|uniref:sister chromatid cohesion protein PDS5 homolog C-like n=1 Tax=Cryptomeria japonica TaxID=3369 RepID=UPI0027DA3D3D|nr:sister chromatid cohesion protein PDS5 homolog C-like [Cryptomeria japonica]